MNQVLGDLLAEHFEQNSLIRLFSGNYGMIRKTLSQMHLTLKEISALELRTRKQTQGTLRFLRKTVFFEKLSNCFKDQMKPEMTVDKNSQLTIMDFAAEETVNQAIIQTTLIAAFLGAIIGGGLTLLAQYLTK